VTILSDLGFGDVKLFEFLESLGFQSVIRFRGNIHVSAANGETRLAADWVGKNGRARKLCDAEVSAARHKVGAVVCVKAVGMKEAWHLAARNGSLSAPRIIKLYSKRWSIEPTLRDHRVRASGRATLGRVHLEGARSRGSRDRGLMCSPLCSSLERRRW
jgi:hypothetical protein